MMEILYFFANDNSYMYDWQTYHIIDELAHHNINFTVFNPLKYTSFEEANELCVKMIAEKKFDCFMTPHNSNKFFKETAQSLKKYSIPMVLINFDNLINPESQKSLSKYFDVQMLLNIDSNKIYKTYSCPCVFAPYAANPFYFKKMDLETVNSVCFVGTPYGTRCHSLNLLLQEGIDLDLYANKDAIIQQRKIGDSLSISKKVTTTFEFLNNKARRKILLGAVVSKLKKREILLSDSTTLKIHGAIDLQTMNRVYSQHSLSVSMPESRNTGVLKKPLDIVRLRNFEIPMCGGLQISRYCEELGNYFEENKEIIFYRSDDEFLDKVRFYLNPHNEKVVNKIKENARYRAESQHTWYLRFKKVFNEIGIQI